MGQWSFYATKCSVLATLDIIRPRLLLLSEHMDWGGVKVDDTQALTSVEDSTILGSAALQYKTVCHQYDSVRCCQQITLKHRNDNPCPTQHTRIHCLRCSNPNLESRFLDRVYTHRFLERGFLRFLERKYSSECLSVDILRMLKRASPWWTVQPSCISSRYNYRPGAITGRVGTTYWPVSLVDASIITFGEDAQTCNLEPGNIIIDWTFDKI